MLVSKFFSKILKLIKFFIIILNILFFYLLDWVAFYRQKWIIASFNKCILKIDNNIRITSSDNTNIVEAAYALSNQYEKNLKLITAILQYVNVFIYFFFFFINI